jgi:hypothetical protein
MMKYYVRQDASSEIEGPFDLEAIRGWIAGGRFTMQHEGVEERGRSTDDVRRSRMWRTLEEIFAEPAELHVEQSPQVFLNAVRERSCYKTLRLCIDLSTFGGWFAGGVYIFQRFASDTQSAVLCGAALILMAIACAALRQSAFVLIDIADVLIEQNRRK